MITIGFADLLSGLNAGQFKSHGRPELQDYFDRYMDRNRYPRMALDVLYEGLRHKVAHLGHPYIVFDTATRPNVFGPGPYRRYGWTVYSKGLSRPLELIEYPTKLLATKHDPPWEVWYDGRINASVRSLSSDLVHSVFRRAGFFQKLRSDPAALNGFMDCMKDFYPPT
jgi:hypothetical protein